MKSKTEELFYESGVEAGRKQAYWEELKFLDSMTDRILIRIKELKEQIK